MDSKPLDIFLAQIRLNISTDIRPVVIVHYFPGGDVDVAPISAALNLYRRDQHFLIDKTRADFRYTGLKKTSFVVSATPVTINGTHLKKRLGRLHGQLAEDFRIWYCD